MSKEKLTINQLIEKISDLRTDQITVPLGLIRQRLITEKISAGANGGNTTVTNAKEVLELIQKCKKL